MVEPTRMKKGVGFTTSIAIALLLGLLCGLFFGEYTEWIKWIGDAFVGLLQMAVLPYVVVSLVANVGRLSVSVGARLLFISTAVLLLLWAVGLITLTLMSWAFPAWETGSFFSSNFTEAAPLYNWMDLFIPSNPFQALAENSIPAVVVFSIGLGIALMNIPNKAALLDPLDVVVDALAKLNKLVVKLTPVGMFAIVAHTAGTMEVEQFSLIQGYLLTYAVAAIVLSFFVLPTLISTLTPFSFREILSTSRDPLIAAFVIGNSFVVLPMIIEAVKRLEEEKDQRLEIQKPDYLVPLAYPFPDVGRIVGLIFIPFAAWFYGITIEPDRYPLLMGVGLLSSFGKLVITIPLLLDLAELPNDIFNLFLASGVVAARFGDLMKTMHLITFTILVSCFVTGTAKLNGRKIIVGIVTSAMLLLTCVLMIRGYLESNFKELYAREVLSTEREMIFPGGASVVVATFAPNQANPDPIREGKTRVERIKDRGSIRIGFDADKMPFCYYQDGNDDNLVGFDIQMAYYLAEDLHVNIEFIPIDRPNLKQHLEDDHFDIVMSAQEGTVNQAAFLPASDPYMDITLAIVIPDHRKPNFRNRDSIEEIPNLKIAVIKDSFFAERAPKVLPDKQDFEIVTLDSATEFFDGQHDDVDGLVISAESGSAWTLRYPKFAVANPLKGEIRVPLYYLCSNDPEFENFLQNWLTLKRLDGTYQQLYDYWILGQDEKDHKPRWCILRDVLHWIE